MKTIEVISVSCDDCRALQREEGDPDALCPEHAESETDLPKFKKMTLQELGANLPIGREDGGTLKKSFDLREFHFEREREIDKMRNKPGGAGNHPGKVTTTALGYMLNEWAGDKWHREKQQKHREAALLGAYMEDVLYAWIYFRATELDPVLSIEAKCPLRHCEFQYVWRGDLRTIEVTVAEEPIKPIPFSLTNPITWMREEYDQLMLMPPKWSAVTMSNANGTIADVKGDLALSAIHALSRSDDPDTLTPMSNRALDYLHKRDIERLTKFVVAGPMPSVDSQFELKCPSCGHAVETPLNWTWDFFFGSSSLSGDLTS